MIVLTCAHNNVTRKIGVHLQDLGQASALGNDRLNITMFAPFNSAFSSPLPPVRDDR